MTATVTRLTSSHLSKKSGDVRQSLKQGEEPELSWRGEPYACVVLLDKRREERALVAELQARVERLEANAALREAETAFRNAELARLREENLALRNRLEEDVAM